MNEIGEAPAAEVSQAVVPTVKSVANRGKWAPLRRGSAPDKEALGRAKAMVLDGESVRNAARITGVQERRLQRVASKEKWVEEKLTQSERLAATRIRWGDEAEAYRVRAWKRLMTWFEKVEALPAESFSEGIDDFQKIDKSMRQILGVEVGGSAGQVNIAIVTGWNGGGR